MFNYNTGTPVTLSDIRKLDTTDLMILIRLHEGQTSRECASSLNLTPPAISHRLRKMEEVFEHGDPLMQVTTDGRVKRALLTEHGKRIAKVCLKFLDDLDTEVNWEQKSRTHC